MTLAQNEWRIMKETDSRECRNCHSFTAMEKQKQRPKAQQRHAEAQQKGMTCIDCHKGIAHLLPDEYDESVDYTAGVVTVPASNGQDAMARDAAKANAPSAPFPPAAAPPPADKAPAAATTPSPVPAPPAGTGAAPGNAGSSASTASPAIPSSTPPSGAAGTSPATSAPR
jgi:hypothetical protein